MKKISLITTAVFVLAMLGSCQKEQITDTLTTGITQFSATITQTKTDISPEGKVTWRMGDEITVTDASDETAVYVAESAGVSTVFNIKEGETPLGEGPYSAAYGDLEKQMYDAKGANCPLRAPQTSTTNFTFSSPYAVLRITANSETEKSISKVTIKNGSVSLASLDCGSGVKLSSDSVSVFYLAIEPDTIAEMSITFETKGDITETATKKRSSEVTLSAGDLLPLSLTFTEDDWKSSCVAAGTMITMENGDRKKIEELMVGDVIRTFDHVNGEISSAPVCFVWESKNVAKAFTLTFEDESEVTEVTIIEEHGFYDQEERKYAFINAYNAKDYIGHHFYDADNDRWLELKSCKLLNKGVDAYAIVTKRNLDHLSNGMLSMCDGTIKILANLFEYNDQMQIDAVKKEKEIAKYGLTPLEKVLEYKGFTKDDYNDYNLMYLNVAIGKGLTSWAHIKALSDYFEANMNP